MKTVTLLIVAATIGASAAALAASPSTPAAPMPMMSGGMMQQMPPAAMRAMHDTMAQIVAEPDPAKRQQLANRMIGAMPGQCQAMMASGGMMQPTPTK